jgi:hypothetical protein
MAKVFSRNTRIENLYHKELIVEVRQDPGNFLEKIVEIEPGKHKYFCHEDIPLGLRPVEVFVYIKGAREKDRVHILPADIRANEKLELNYSSERGFTITHTRGNFIPRLGYFPRLQPLINFLSFVVLIFTFFLFHCLLTQVVVVSNFTGLLSY